MRRISVELQPAQAVAQRMQAMQLDLQRARQHLRRERRGHGVGQADRWGLEQAGTAPQDEDWLITYLDMVTLLMVAMIVMLAFAGPMSKQIQAARHETAPAAAAPSLAAARIPAPDEAAAPYPAAPAEAFKDSLPPPPAPAVAPLAGTFPEPARSQAPDTGPSTAVTGLPPPSTTPPETAAPVPAPTPTAQESGISDALSSQLDDARLIGIRSRPALAVEPPGPAPSEGESMAASLPLGELGKDVEVIVNKRSVSFRVNSEILFDTGQTDLSREGLAVLKRMAQVLINAGYDITVEGHTDSVRVRSSSPYPSNWELSSARAGTVVRYLQANGIPKSRLKAVGFADSRPIADNGTPEGRARNRRVELVVSKHRDE